MPFSPNGFAPSSGPGINPATSPRRPDGGATVSLALDNMIRNKLKVSDPRNPKQIADALLAYYQDLPQAAAIKQEAQGLPFLQVPAMPALPAPQATSSDAEFKIANSDVEKALQDLSTNALTNAITPEMQGWADSIRLAVTQGHAAARQGLDPTQRDKVIAMRRQLGEYGRMARFVGSLSPGMTQNFRRLGQAMDEVSAVLLVILGESLASVGFASGYYLLQVPLAEVQQRRDAVIFALRNFMGGAQEAYGPDDWPRGIDAYRRLYEWLEQQGQGDLRSLLLENEIAQTMDALIARAQNGTPEGLRALGVTAQLDIERFRRMAIVAEGAMMGQGGHFDRSPPLESYVQALRLFAETFRPAGGLRLLRIARPPILFYGIYNPNLLEDDSDLVKLIMVRGRLATIFDGLFPGSGARSVDPQVLLDMLLLEFDRGIDLLALGAKPKEKGPTERRAVAYWLIVRVIRRLLAGLYLPALNTYPGGGGLDTVNGPDSNGNYAVNLFPTTALQNLITWSKSASFPYNNTLYVYLVPPVLPTTATPPFAWGGPYKISVTASSGTITSATIEGIPGSQISPPSAAVTGGWGGAETLMYVSFSAPPGAFATLAVSDLPGTSAGASATFPFPGPIATKAANESRFLQLLTQVASVYLTGTSGVDGLRRAFADYDQLSGNWIPSIIASEFLNAVGEELRVQNSLEQRWQDLVRTVAPEAADQEAIFSLLRLVVEQAIHDVETIANTTYLPRVPTALPPQFEQSLEEIAHAQWMNQGGHRPAPKT